MKGLISAACYIRVSTEDQTEYSPDAQRKALEAYAKQHDMVLSPEHIYVDAGLSGRRAATRPSFMAMIAAAKERPPPFSVILVHKFDRFARNREDSIVYKSMLRRQCGIQVISITERLEDDRMGLILEAMLEAMAEYYSINLGDEVRKGMAEKARRGELQTSPPYGYRASENRLIPVPKEAGVVRELYHRFLDGASIASLARWAGRQRILSHRGNPLDSRGIRYILENPVYIGKLRWGIGEEKGKVADGNHTPLVEQDTYYAVQRLLVRKKGHGRKHIQPDESRKHWLAGLVRCGACGGGMVFSGSRYLRCGRYVKGKCSESQHVRADHLEEVLLARLQQDGMWAEDLTITPLPEAVHERRESLSCQLAGMGKRLTRLRDAYLCGAETVEEYRMEKARLLRQENRLREELEQEIQNEEALAKNVIEQSVSDIPSASRSSSEAKYRAASAVLSSCRWEKQTGTLSLFYRWQA